MKTEHSPGDVIQRRERTKGFKTYARLLDHKRHEIVQDRHNVILRPVESSREAEYFSTLEGVLGGPCTKLLLKRIAEGKKRDVQNILSGLKRTKDEFNEFSDQEARE